MAHTRRFRSQSVALGLTLVGASAFMSGCSEEADYQGICVDPTTEMRVDDDSCDDVDEDYDGTGSGFFWFYMATGSNAPAVGQRYNPTSGVYKVSSSKTSVKGGVSKSGGSITVVKGGFGSGFGKSSS